jgi:hypothetical protein
VLHVPVDRSAGLACGHTPYGLLALLRNREVRVHWVRSLGSLQSLCGFAESACPMSLTNAVGLLTRD